MPVLNLGSQPMCDDLVPIGNPSMPTAYPIELLGYHKCVTVHQKYQVEKTTLFPRNYHYRAALTKDVLDGMAELVALTAKVVGPLSGKVVLDIGCNDGSLLKIFRDEGAITIGIEPTDAALDAADKIDHIINAYFDDASTSAYLETFSKPDVITFTNVFAHIEDLSTVVSNLKRLAKDDTTIIIENHYLGSVLARSQFDTFYHEHPRTYSLTSFRYIASSLGYGIAEFDFPSRYNGNIRVVMQRHAIEGSDNVDETGFINSFGDLNKYIENQRANMLLKLKALVEEFGPLPAKAFPGRAGVIIAYYGLDESIISAAYERPGSAKIGNYIPGTRIPILDETIFFANQHRHPVLVNLAWHIKDEIHRYMREGGYKGEILEIFS